MGNKLKLWFDKNINDIKGCLPNGEKGRWDIYLLFNAFLGIKILDDNNLITELKNRGYDISTIKFEITKKNSEIQPVTTKDLTLDMWDKSIVNKIKRLEKSIELNNKVKKDLKKQLDQLKQQLAEKQNTIDEINKEFVQAVHDWKALCAEKDKEIEKLKQQYTILENENGKLAKELIVKNYKKAQKEVSFGIQLAIQELEKAKQTLNNEELMVFSTPEMIIDQQIKELKGEKE